MPLCVRRSGIDFILRHNVQTQLRSFYFIHAQMNCVCTSWQQLLDDRAKVTGTPFSPNMAISYERSDCVNQLVTQQVRTNRALPYSNLADRAKMSKSVIDRQDFIAGVKVSRKCVTKRFHKTFSREINWKMSGAPALNHF